MSSKLPWTTVMIVVLMAMALVAQPVMGQVAGQVPLVPTTIPKYVEPLPVFGPAGTNPRVSGSTPLVVSMEEFQQKVLPVSFYTPLVAPYNAGTYVWGYKVGSSAPLYPAFSIEAQRGLPTTITYENNLQNSLGGLPELQKYLPVDQTLHWADPLMAGMPMTQYVGPVPAVVHLHGGEVPSAFDGGPDSWFTPGMGIKGPAFITNTYTYDNSQEPATIWFHDHALGTTRLNVYAGMAGFYILRGPAELATLPSGPQEIEIAIQDRMFDTNGQLLFPSLGINPMQHPFWLPEFFGDVIVVNGKTWPFLNVEARRYRFRLLNGSNARFYELKITNQGNGSSGPVFWQIGTDGGYLDIPVSVKTLLLAPGERADVIVDFAAFANKTLTVTNSAKAPYPKGVAPDPKTVGQIMQFRVRPPLPAGTDNSYNPALGGALRSLPIVRLANPQTGTLAAGITPNNTRQLTLNEVMGMAGPLEVLVNNAKWAAPYTENPRVGSTEVWEIVNMTADAHPIHLHLVQFQLLNRQNFNVAGYLKAYNASFPGGPNPADGLTYAAGVYMPGFGPPLPYAGVKLGGNPDVTPFLSGKATPPNPNEAGWKDTFVMYPGQVTRVVIRWAPQDATTSSPGQNLFTFDPTDGPGYVWHCHIIDHEDNEMMRPYQVAGPITSGIGTPVSNKTVAFQDDSRFESTLLPTDFALEQNYPNPFNPATEIRFALPQDSHVLLKIYNSLGQEVQTLLDNSAPAGNHTVKLDASRLSSGTYFYRLQAGDYTAMKKMMLVK